MKNIRVASPALTFAALLTLACLASVTASCSRAPEVTPQRTLDLNGDPAASGTPAPFAVVFASPKGAVTDVSEVTIVFNRPMRPLELADDHDETAPPASVTASTAGGKTAMPAGAWRWLGTQALMFAPDRALARATTYTVTIPAATKALDGSVLKDAYVSHFSTTTPTLARIEPSEGSRHATPTQAFELRFDQPVEPKAVERAVTMRIAGDDKAKPIAVRATRPKSDTPALVKIVPTTKLPLATKLELVIDASLTGTEGPMPSGKERRVAFETYGPLKIESFDCPRETPHKKCAPYASPVARLSNNVTFADLKAHVRIEPPLPITWSTTRDAKSLLDYVSISAEFKPVTSHRVVITAGLRDEYGQVLAADASFNVDTDEIWPAAGIGLTGTTFESEARASSDSDKKRNVPITSVNVDRYELVTSPLDDAELAGIVFGERIEGGSAKLDTFEAAKKAKGAKVATITPAAERNVEAVTRVSLDDVLATHKGHGPAFFGIRFKDPHNEGKMRTETRLVSVTDLAISAKMSRFGSVVWVTHLSTGKAASGAQVTVRTPAGELFATKTDDSGLAAIPANTYMPADEHGNVDGHAVIIAHLGDDASYQAVSENLSPWRYDVSSDIAGGMHPFGMLFADRGVYRPGETVRVKGVFRTPTPRGTATPAGSEVRLTVFDGTGDKIHDSTAKLDPFGEMSIDVAVPATAHLGETELRAELEPRPGKRSVSEGDAERYGPSSATASVLLAAYKAAEFKVAVETEKPSYVRGDKLSFTTRGDYLYGAPMSGGTVRFTANRGPGYFVPPGVDAEATVLDDDTFARDLDDANLRGGQMQSGEGALDAKGSMASAVPLPMPGQHGTELLTLESEVEDISRQSIAGRTSVLVHPAQFYVAMARPKDFFVQKGAKLSLGLSAIEPSGKVRAGVAVKVDLVHRTWSTVVETNSEGGAHYSSKTVDTVSASCSVATAATLKTPTACDLVVPDAGYFILRAQSQDPAGNVVAASTPLYATGDATDAIGWSASDASKVDLVADKKTYEVGDTARILIKNPFRDAEALVTVERAGIYSQQRIAISGPTPTVSIPVTDAMRPNAYVGVHLVRGRIAPVPETGADIGGPAFRVGYAQIVVNPEARRLKVAVTPSKKETRPGEAIDVDLAVVDRAGKPVKSEVTFYVVDEGVLMLTGYKTPDPIPVFTAPRSLAVFALEARNDMGRIYQRRVGESGADKGDEGGGGGGDTRSDFRATAFFEPGIVTGNDGKATVHVKLPDNLTTFRLMAVAASEDDRFGSGESQVVSSRKLMARPALPRFVRAGDTIRAGVIVATKGMGESRVDVTLAAEGAELRGPATQTVTVPANGSLEVRWAIATPTAGKAKLTFKVSGGGETDAVVVERDVKIPMSLEAVALAGETTKAAGERMGDIAAIRTDVGKLDVKLASTALVGLGSGAEQLLEYPYGCTEQLTSRLLPMIPLRALATDFNVPLPNAATLPKVIDETIAKILKNQRGDGGFGYWGDSRYSDPWLSAYVLFTLDAARKDGRAVPDTATDDAVKYVRRFLEKGDGEKYERATQAFMVDVLATVGKADAGYTNKLYDARGELPLFARALLAHAIVMAKMDPKQAQELLRDAEAHLRVTSTGATVVENVGDAYAPILDSEARTTALVLRSLVAIDPKHPLASRIARGLLGMRKGGAWGSTQEAAWALLALDAYRHGAEESAPRFDARVFLGKTKLFTAEFNGKSTKEAATSLTTAKLAEAQSQAGGSTFAFDVDGSGKLFYEARLTYARKELPREGIDRGFFVRKVVRQVSPEALKDALATVPRTSATSATGGALVLVDLFVVTANPRDQVVIDDPLPAGLEPVDVGFATTAQSLDVSEPGGAGDDADESQSDDDAVSSGRAYGSAWFHRELHDDRVLTFVEHMAAGMYHYRYVARATTFGTFVVPPARAECMYEPDVFGRTGATVFEVREEGAKK